MSLIVIAVKLSQPFDNIARFPESTSDPSLLRLDWQKWVDITKDDEREGLARGTEVQIKDVDVLTMEGKDMDDYLDWFQRTWIDDRDQKCKIFIPI